MAQVFLSYDSDDRSAANKIAVALEKAGYAVWWDKHISGGSQYAKEIEQALADADVVVVLWSPSSVESPWVRDEAGAGRDRGRLVPLSLEATSPPLGFRQFHSIDLGYWSGRRKVPRLAEILAAIERQGSVPGVLAPPQSARKNRQVLNPWLLALLVVGLAITAVALWIWKPGAGGSQALVSVRAAGGDAASAALARNLASRLGALNASSATPVRIVETTDAAIKPVLAFETTATGAANATLVLKFVRDSSILWSHDFSDPAGHQANLLQQLSYTAGRIVRCALDGIEGPVRLKPAALRTYLNMCAQLSEFGSLNSNLNLAHLAQLTVEEPRFEPAWTALLLAEAALLSAEEGSAGAGPEVETELKRHIERARSIFPALPAADLAEAALLEPTDFDGRMARLERAAAQSPDNPVVVSQLAGALFETGRVNDAVERAADAVKLDPLSPILHAGYTTLLAYGGNFASAKRELARAEALWPGTASVEDAKYRFHLRYGDPEVARTIFEKHNKAGGRGPRMLLAARRSPGPATIEPFLAFVRERLRNMEDPSAGIGFATTAFAQFNRKDDVFEILLNWRKVDDLAMMSEVYFRPEFNSIRRDPRFMRVAKRSGLLGYWVKSGRWPDFCFASEKTYDCKAEAAKLE